MKAVHQKGALAYGLLVASAVWVLSLSQVADYDLWWHISKGDWLLEHGELLERDPYSHTAAGAPDVDTSWLFDVGAALSARWFGIEALPILGATLTALTFVLLFAAGCLAGVGPAPLAIGILAVTPMLRFYLVLRPHLVSFACLALLLLLLCAFDRTKRRAMLAASVPLIWLWRQIHPSYPLGLVVLCVFLIFPHILRRDPEDSILGAASMSWASRALILLAASLCLFLPPLGWSGTVWIFETLRLLQAHGGLVAEWLPPTSFDDVFGEFWIYTAIGCLGLLLSRRARTPFTVTTFGLSCLMALGGIRHICGFAILTLIPVVGAWTDILGRFSTGLGAVAIVLRTAAVVAASVYCVASGVYAEYPPFGVGIAENAFPRGAARFIEKYDVRGRMYNTHRLGGYLLWRLGEGGAAEGRKVFWDGRLLQYLGLFDELRAAIASADVGKALDELLARRGVDYAILDHRDEHPIAQRLRGHPDWPLVFWDDSALVLARRDGPGKRLQAFEWRAVRPWDRALRFLEASGAQAAQVRVELQRKLQEDPGCSRAMAMYGLMLLQDGHAAGAASLLGRFLKERKESEWVRLVYVQALLVGGRPREALAALEPLTWSRRSRAAVRRLGDEARHELESGTGQAR